MSNEGDTVSVEEGRKSGLTQVSFTALLYATAVFTPAIIWLGLTVPFISIPFVGWMTLLLFVELMRLTGRRLSVQEGIIVLQATETGVSALVVGLVYRVYYKTSSYATMFQLTNQIPWWWAPELHVAEKISFLRTFFNSAWVPIITVALVIFLLGVLADLAMGLFARELFVKVEKLPFPVQVIGAEGVLTLTEREPKRMRAFTLGINIALVYAALLYLPYFLGRPILPVPWADLNPLIHMVGLKGASFGVATDLLFIASGFIIPFYVNVSMFIGSLAIWFVGNWILVAQSWTEFALEWKPRMDIALTMQRAMLHCWTGPLVGVTIAAGLLPILRHPRYLTQALQGLSGRTGSMGRRRGTLWLFLCLWLGASVASIVLTYYLVPGYPIWVMLLFSLGWSLVYTLSSARAIGETGIGLVNPNLLPVTKYAYISASGYRGADIWFIDPVISLGGPAWCAAFKTNELCGCTDRSYIKAYFLVLPVSLIAGFVYMALFWNTAPIPSEVYPATAVTWPISALTQSLWFSGQLLVTFRPEWILYAFLAMSSVFFISDFAHIPFSIAGFAAGCYSPIPIPVTILIGGVAGKIIARLMGKEWWNTYKPSIAAGITLGEVVIIAIGSSVIMILKSLWALPY